MKATFNMSPQTLGERTYLSVGGRELPDDSEHMEPKIL